MAPVRIPVAGGPRGAVRLTGARLPGASEVLLALEDLTASRTADQQLRAANAELTEAHRRLSEFLGMLSHELRNPLAPIRNALYIFEHAEPTGQQARRAKEIATRQVAHLCDIGLPGMDGYEIARRLRAGGATDLRLVAVSG